MEILEVISLATFGSVLALVGGVTILAIPSWRKQFSSYSTPFAAGVLIAVALLGLIPEAVYLLDEAAGWWILAGFLFSYLFEWLVCDLHHHGDTDHHDHHHKHQKHSTVWLLMFGDTIHNFADGVAIGASFLINPGLAVVTAVSTFLHEVPHELGDFAVMVDAGWRRAKIILLNLVSALATILGAVLVYWLQPDQSWVGGLIGIAAGLFLYLSATDLLPRSGHKLDRRVAGLVFMLGVCLMGLVIWALPH